MKIQNLPLHARPREKLLQSGVASLSESELLAILLRSGYQGKSALDVAKRLLSHFTLNQLTNLPVTTLAKLKGVGISRAVTIHCIREAAARLQPENSLGLVRDTEDVIKLLSHLKHKKQEHLVALYMNARSQLIELRTITVGTLNSSFIHPREIFAAALELHAASIILAHNHPSGDCSPSEEDIYATERLIDVGDLLDIPIIDHVIVGSGPWVSLRKEHYI